MSFIKYEIFSFIKDSEHNKDYLKEKKKKKKVKKVKNKVKKCFKFLMITYANYYNISYIYSRYHL